jgi:hypothetical protein
LTDSQRQAIVQLHKASHTTEGLAKLDHVSPDGIRGILCSPSKRRKPPARTIAHPTYVRAVYREAGSYLGAARLLSHRGFTTIQGRKWHAASLRAIILRAAS